MSGWRRRGFLLPDAGVKVRTHARARHAADETAPHLWCAMSHLRDGVGRPYAGVVVPASWPFPCRLIGPSGPQVTGTPAPRLRPSRWSLRRSSEKRRSEFASRPVWLSSGQRARQAPDTLAHAVTQWRMKFLRTGHSERPRRRQDASCVLPLENRYGPQYRHPHSPQEKASLWAALSEHASHHRQECSALRLGSCGRRAQEPPPTAHVDMIVYPQRKRRSAPLKRRITRHCPPIVTTARDGKTRSDLGKPRSTQTSPQTWAQACASTWTKGRYHAGHTVVAQPVPPTLTKPFGLTAWSTDIRVGTVTDGLTNKKTLLFAVTHVSTLARVHASTPADEEVKELIGAHVKVPVKG